MFHPTRLAPSSLWSKRLRAQLIMCHREGIAVAAKPAPGARHCGQPQRWPDRWPLITGAHVAFDTRCDRVVDRANQLAFDVCVPELAGHMLGHQRAAGRRRAGFHAAHQSERAQGRLRLIDHPEFIPAGRATKTTAQGRLRGGPGTLGRQGDSRQAPVSSGYGAPWLVVSNGGQWKGCAARQCPGGRRPRGKTSCHWPRGP
jgi:hypothetical protein